MKVADNQYLYRLETQNENGVSIDYIDVETVEPLRSVQDIHDEIDLENNKQIKRIEEIVFTGDSDEYWYNDDTHTTDTHFVAYMEGINLFCNVDHPYCETDRAVFEFGDVHIDENKNFFCTSVELNGMNRIYISIDKSLLAYTVYSHETLKEYFKENPVTVWYVLRYPVEIPRIHAKGHVITHHDNTVIDVQPQTMGKVTPIVKATINDTQIEMDSVPTMTIDGTTEGNQITDLTFEGVTIVNNAKADEKKGTKEVSHTRYDFPPFYDGQTTINNTVEGGYVSAKLYGDTMINIAKPYGETELLTATEDSAITDLLGANTDGVIVADGEITEGRVYGDSLVNLFAYTPDDMAKWVWSANTGGAYMWGTSGYRTKEPIIKQLVVGKTYTFIYVNAPEHYKGMYLSGMFTSDYSQSQGKISVFTVDTIPQDAPNFYLYSSQGFTKAELQDVRIVVLEGDWSDRLDEIEYFEGIISTTNPEITFTTHPFIFGKGGRL